MSVYWPRFDFCGGLQVTVVAKNILIIKQMVFSLHMSVAIRLKEIDHDRPFRGRGLELLAFVGSVTLP